MYGEETDMCLRAERLGYRPMITPDAEIMHLVGASTRKREDKTVKVLKAKATLIRDHWSRSTVPVGIALLWSWGALRRLAAALISRIHGDSELNAYWHSIWHQRHDWLAGY